MSFTGQCHCGNIELKFESNRLPREIQVRACGCSFCSRHGARTTTDPLGHVKLQVRKERELIRYQFGLRTAEFLICGNCGVYVGALLQTEGYSFFTLNVNTLEGRSQFSTGAISVSYEEENAAERLERRKRNWTPCTLNG
jgi:hypothetical protein